MRIVTVSRGIAVLIALLGAAPAAAQDASWHTYTDARRGFSIAYPDGWTVDPKFVDHGYGFYQGDSDDVRDGVAFKPTSDLAPGTNLQSNQLMLVVETARPGDLCQANAFLMTPPPDYFTKTLVDKPDAVQTMAEAGDLYTIEHIVILAARKPCIAVHYVVVSAQISRGDPKPPKPFNREALLGLLGRIAGTLKTAP